MLYFSALAVPVLWQAAAILCGIMGFRRDGEQLSCLSLYLVPTFMAGVPQRGVGLGLSGCL